MWCVTFIFTLGLVVSDGDFSDTFDQLLSSPWLEMPSLHLFSCFSSSLWRKDFVRLKKVFVAPIIVGVTFELSFWEASYILMHLSFSVLIPFFFLFLSSTEFYLHPLRILYISVSHSYLLPITLSFLLYMSLLVSTGPLTTTQVTTTLPARPFTSSTSPSTTRPLAPTSRPIGSINKHPDLRPITATVPVTRRPPRPPQGPEPYVCEAKLVRGVQWPTTQRGETVDRPCPKGSLGEDKCMCIFLNEGTFFPLHKRNNMCFMLIFTPSVCPPSMW